MKTVVTVALAFCLSVAVFASGENQSKESYPDRWGVSDFVVGTSEAQVYTGAFRMEEDAYPAILTDEGELYYLMLPGMIARDNLQPDEGAALTIEAFKVPFSPVHLMVVSAEVNGEEVDMAWSRKGPGPWRGGRGKHYKNYHGRYGWSEYGPRCMPGWDYPKD